MAPDRILTTAIPLGRKEGLIVGAVAAGDVGETRSTYALEPEREIIRLAPPVVVRLNLVTDHTTREGTHNATPACGNLPGGGIPVDRLRRGAPGQSQEG